MPDKSEQAVFQSIILKELTAAIFNQESCDRLVAIVRRCQKDYQCDAAILACTELPLVLNQDNCGMPVVDTTRLLAIKAYEHSLLTN